MKTQIMGLLCFFVFAVFGASSALADTDFSFSYAGAGTTASGTLFTTPQPDGSFLITGMSGTRNGQAMNLLAPNAFAANDNLLLQSTPVLDFGGFSFVAGGTDYNVYFNTPACCGGVQAYYENPSASATSLGTLIDFTVTPVPEPSSLLLCLSGLGTLVGLMLAGRRS